MTGRLFGDIQTRNAVFAACLFFVYFLAGYYAGRPRPAAHAQQQHTSGGHGQRILVDQHPIPKLMADAEDKFRLMLARQSKTLSEAVSEYKRRYGRDPPKGFDDWFYFALENDVILLDEYDAINEDLSPFYSLSGHELRSRIDKVGSLPSIRLVRIRNGVTNVFQIDERNEDGEVQERAEGFVRMMTKFENKLPDLDFPINGKAEGRILVPWKYRQDGFSSQASASIDDVLGPGFTADWHGDGNVWESWRRTCPPNSKARRLFSSVKAPPQPNIVRSLLHKSNGGSLPPNGANLTFAETVSVEYDFCQNPSDRFLQGHFFSDWRTIPVLIPVFSPAKANGYSDIRVPSHYYHEPTAQYSYGWDPIILMGKDSDDMELPWENKTDTIFWRGSTTGGGNTPSGFAPQYQRHRRVPFVRMANSPKEDPVAVVFPLPGSPSSFMTASVPLATLNEEIMDVAFVRLLNWQNYPGGRAALRKQHRFSRPVPLGEHWKYKYLMDTDGMAYSGRFFAFLASDSVPLKATVYKEYFSDWIQPWLHYVPVSQSFDEIYNIFAFFSGPTPSLLEAANVTRAMIRAREDDGDKRLRRIARAGKQWKNTIGRPVDMEAYVYRLALEWARLCADDRDSMSFKLINGD